jgi:mannose-6-phosphate isomerase-like protein (cupin superfamily)
MFVSAAEIADRIADAAAKTDAKYQLSAHTAANEKAREKFENTYLHQRPLLQAGSFRAELNYYATPETVFRAHDSAAQMLVLLDGSGTIAVGGVLVRSTRTAPDQLQAQRAQGAVPHKMVKGDVLLVPANTPHRLSQVEDHVVLMSLPLPLPASNGSAR